MITLRADYLARVFRSVLSHVSKDDTRPHLNSVLLEPLDGGGLAVVATDGHRLALWCVPPGDMVSVSIDAAPTLVRLAEPCSVPYREIHPKEAPCSA
jgi:DNA polymerase III sliding clamp (beta) subunit (PCNA family)